MYPGYSINVAKWEEGVGLRSAWKHCYRIELPGSEADSRKALKEIEEVYKVAYESGILIDRVKFTLQHCKIGQSDVEEVTVGTED